MAVGSRRFLIAQIILRVQLYTHNMMDRLAYVLEPLGVGHHLETSYLDLMITWLRALI